MNSKMQMLLGDYAFNLNQVAQPVPNDLLKDLQQGFEEFQGCVLWRQGERTPFEFDVLQDKTGVECTDSEIHLKVSTTVPVNTALGQAIGYAFALSEALGKSGLEGPFRIIIGADVHGDYPSVTVRHHRFRVGQPWLSDDLEGYEDAILVFDLN